MSDRWRNEKPRKLDNALRRVPTKETRARDAISAVRRTVAEDSDFTPALRESISRLCDAIETLLPPVAHPMARANSVAIRNWKEKNLEEAVEREIARRDLVTEAALTRACAEVDAMVSDGSISRKAGTALRKSLKEKMGAKQ